MRRRFSPVASVLFPIPFLMLSGMLVAAFWQNDADFVFGHVRSVEAVLVDAGTPHKSRGRPRYFPTFSLPNADTLTLTQPLIASELPVAGESVQLLCSTRTPTNCRTPASEPMHLFYGLALLWTAGSIGIALLMWAPLYRECFARN